MSVDEARNKAGRFYVGRIVGDDRGHGDSGFFVGVFDGGSTRGGAAHGVHQ